MVVTDHKRVLFFSPLWEVVTIWARLRLYFAPFTVGGFWSHIFQDIYDSCPATPRIKVLKWLPSAEGKNNNTQSDTKHYIINI